MKALVLLALSKAVLSALASQVTPDKETKTQSVSSTELEALNNLSVDVQSGAFVVEPGEIFEVTARVNGDFSRAPLERSLWLGLRFLPVGDADAQEQSARASELLWEKLEGSTASWSLKLNGKGEYRALVLGQFYCNVEEKSFKEADYLPCLQPLPLRQGTELQIRVSHVSARLKLSWDKPQTIRALSRLKDAPQGELQVSAISLDGSELRRDFKGTVYLVAIGTNEESNFSSQPALGGQTSARLINGVATFSNLQLVREGTFRLVATADGAQATESATVIVAPAVSRVIRFCEQPPAVIFVPQTAAIRVAVEVLLASGGRDTSFVGPMQLQLHATDGDATLPKDFYETQCGHGLCLWSDLVLRSPPGKYHIKAAVAGQAALGVPSTDAEYGKATVRPAVSAPIVFKRKFRFPQMEGKNSNEVLGHAESETASLLWFVQTVPRAVRVGQPWDLEVAVDLRSLNLTQSVLHNERSRRERATLGRRSALAGWSSWTEGSNLSRSPRSWQDRHHFIHQHRKTEPPNGLQHKLQVFIAESWPEGSIVLSGKTEGITNGQGLATISGLALWLQDQRTPSFRKPSWVKLRVVCTSCSRAKKEFRTQLGTPKIYLDTASAVGVYSDAGKAASALLRWQSAKILHEPRTESAALILPGHPAQLCVQLLDRPFADVLIKAQHEPGLILLGESTKRISPYAWPVSACWKFKAMSFESQSEVHENGHKVYFQLISIDVSYSTSARVRWKGMAASDGSVKVIVLPSRPTLGPVAFRDLLRNPDVSRVAMLDIQQTGSPKWIELRSGPLQERVRLPMFTKVARSSRKTQAHTAAEQWAENKERLFLQWQSPAVVVELLPPQTKVVLELRPSAPLRSILQITGQCVDTDAGNILVATLNRTIGTEISGGQSESKNQNSYGEQKSQELKLLLDWSQLNPSSAGLLRHRVLCDFRVTSHEEQQVQFLPRASVDVIIIRQQCEEGEVFTFQRGCEPCPEGFECSLGTAKPCKPGEFSPSGSLMCQAFIPHRETSPVDRSGHDPTECPTGMYLLFEDGSPQYHVCPAGFFCQGGKKEPCSSGTYAPVGSGLCYSCPEDAVCTDPAKRPEQCPLGWQRKGDEQVCTPCPPGKMCNGWSGIAAREFTDVRCPLGTYTKAEYPGVCIPCPPGFQCPDPMEAPQPCPSGTSSLGGSRTCSAAPTGLIVELGKEHLPPRPCDDGLMPIEVDGKWWCGVGYDDTSFDSEQNSSPMRSSPVASTDVTRAQSFPNLCTANLMDHKSCFSSYLPPKTWCPAYGSTTKSWPSELANGPFYGKSGGFSQFFASCGYTQTIDDSSTRIQCRTKVINHPALGTRLSSELICQIGYLCGPQEWRPIRRGYFQLSWQGGVTGWTTQYDTPKEYPCWEGHKCEGKHHWPRHCLPGTYSNEDGTDCIKCPAGWPCPNSRTNSKQLVIPCWPGHYCPEGSASPTAKPCPAGTINHESGSKDISACKPCPAGWLCAERSFHAVGREPCPSGHYCPEGSKEGIPCPAGTYSPYPGASDRMKSDSDCVPCLAGYYCKKGSSFFDMLSQPCPKGRVCPAGTDSEKGPKCPPGFYSSVGALTDPSECTPCPAGYYCDYGDENSAPEGITGQCPSGTMSLNTGLYGEAHAIRPIPAEAGMDAQCVACDPGYECADGVRVACARGLYSDGSASCLPCKAGHYCSEEATTEEQMNKQKCPAGVFCDAGVDSIPTLASHPCKAGSYCPEGVSSPIKCEKGTVNPKTGQADKTACVPVAAGQYASVEGLAEAEGSCSVGYYCPEGSTSATMHHCPAGKYSAQPGAASEEECDKCPQGYYCPGSSTPQECPKGQYCELGSIAPKPCPSGTFSSATRNSSLYDCTACLPGYYCEDEGLSSPTGACEAGYLCYEGASSPRPTDGKTGEPCTAGGYCEEGATTKSYCPPGKYNPSPGASSKDDCIDCPAGKYCTGSHSPEPDGPCAPGAYCTGGSETSRQKVARKGYYAAEGSSEELPCPPGSFSPHEGLAECYLCAPGWVTKTEGSTKCDPCTYGHYCPTEGTSTEVPCPLGTFRETGFGSSINSCYQCPPYKACTSTGNKELEKNLPYCEAGYYCIYGSPATQPSKDDETYDPNKAGPCPAGFYCETQQILTPCPRGSLGTNEMQRSATDCAKCPAGKVCQDIAGLTATECPEGFICPEGTMAAERVANLCPVGKFCPAGSTDGTNCAKGSFAPTKGMLECVKCPAGYLCEDPSLNLSQQPCPEGYFCPAASSDKQACPAGTVGFAENLSNESLCLRCPPGHYCPNEATAIPDNMEQCPPGKYSSRGSKDQSECKECPVGYYCPEASSTPIPCPGGMLCTAAGQEQPNEDCPEGFYCEAGTLQHSYSVAQVCPAGAYCPTNSSSPTLCPMGTTSQNQGATSETACTPCPAGSYCGSPGLTFQEGSCTAGYFCPEGSFVSQPTKSRCPAGYQCPAGSSEAIACDTDLNQYQPKAGQASCEICPAGFACTSTDAELCPTGKYCAPGMKAQACSAGTFNPIAGSQSEASCLPCLPGWACSVEGLEEPDTKCAAGHFCVSGASSATPEDEWTEGGGSCSPGFFCPEGSFSPTPCPGGKYCSDEKASAPKGDCVAGHFCAHGATDGQSSSVFNPLECPSNVKQGICPPGSVCPQGSAFPYNCPAGTVRKNSGGTSFEDCEPCPEGAVCSLLGATKVTDEKCLDGRYCKEGSRTKFGIPCPVGHKCTSKNAAPVKCPVGTYQPAVGAVTCEPCPPGFVCAQEGTSKPEECPAGYFCVEGIKTPCPAGTYLENKGASASTACKPCPPGKACPTEASTSDSSIQDCQEGYYCRLGAPSVTPTEISCSGDDRTACLPGSKCPIGYYCPSGSSTPLGCPLGTTGSKEGATSDSDCSPCPAGLFCPPGGGQFPCDAGFYCTGGASVPRPTDNKSGGICPLGHYCDGGAKAIPCEPGTYADSQGLAECKKCPAGFVCSNAGDETGISTPCPEGKVCPEGSIDATNCPVGTLGKAKGLQDISQCSLCPPGKYCDQEGSKEPSGDCAAGYYCQAGSTEQAPDVEDWPNASGKCPPGHYCPQGSAAPQSCPPGTFYSSWGAQDVDECQPCTAGMFCGSWGLSEPEGYCSPGFYCKEGSSSPSPIQEAAGDLCPSGNYCPEGSEQPKPCPANTFIAHQGSSECLQCPAGFTCSEGAVEPEICPAGYYCELGKEPTLCPGGTKSTLTGLSEAGQCIECGSGQACDGLRAVGTCREGFLCLAGVGPSTSPELWQNLYSPAAVQIGGPCPLGHFCHEGATVPTACQRGTSTVQEGGKTALDCLPCSAGWYCSLNSSEVLECPAGKYCPAGSVSPVSCPAGTYNLLPQAESADRCETCPAGYVCTAGTADYSQWPCPIGYFCPEGSAMASPCAPGTYGVTSKATLAEECQQCPPGYFCEGADAPPSPCPAGQLCEQGSSQQLPCPSGSYCPAAVESPLSCPSGYYCPEASPHPELCAEEAICPEGAKEPLLCPAGTYRASSDNCTQTQSIEACCEECPAGTHAPSSGASVCDPCPTGYLCYGGTATSTPQLPHVDHGEPCPPGYYCPAGSSAPQPCPAGTYNDQKAGANLLEACKPCDPDTYSDTPGQTGCFACGSTSTASAGQTTCTCLGEHRWFQPSQGSCICEGGYESYDVAGTSFSNLDSSLDCQPIVRQNCAGSQIAQLATSQTELRDKDGLCVDPLDCESVCPDGKGRFLHLSGQCICLPAVETNALCDEECRREALRAHYEDGDLVFSSEANGLVTRLSFADFSVNGRVLGKIGCRKDINTDCAIHFYDATSEGILGRLSVPQRLQDELNLSHRYLATGTTTEGVLRHLSAEATSLTVKAPVQCLQLYDSVVWWVGEGVYPIFLKDSLLNTNTEIDISAFLQLASSMGSRDMSRSFRNTRSTSSSLEYFVYTFTVEGVFAFGTSEDSSPQAIFSVVGEGIQCATGTRFPETATHSSLARIGAQLQQVLNVEPDLTISLLTFACLLVVLVLLLVSISAARRSQYKKRQALDRKDISERKDLVLGNRSAALTMRRRLESLLADLIEQRLCKQENNKVLALQPEQLESMLAEIPRGTLQPQAFENAFGVLHELSLQLNSFSSMASYEYHETTKDLAVEISRLQKEILITLAPVKQRLQHRDRLRGLMAPMMENINRLLGELRSTDLFISAAASGNDFEDSEEGEHAIIIRKLLIPANIGESTMLHLRLLHATVYAERFITQASDRFQVFSASERMVKACITTLKAQKTQTDGAADALAQEKLQLLQGAHNLLAEGCKLLASGRDAKESMKERFAEYRRREEDILNSCRRQYSAAIDAEVAIALQSLIDREDVLLQGHLSRLTSLAAAAQLPSAESRSNKQKAARALHSYSNECRAHFKQALKITTEALHKQLSEVAYREQAAADGQEQQREALVAVLLDQKSRGEAEYMTSVHSLERQLLLLCTQLAIQNKKAAEEEFFQAAVNGWTEALQSEIRTQAQTLRRQAKAGELEESEYRQQKASLASSLDLNIQRITREQFSSKAERIDQFEREATSAYESLMEATHKRQKLEDDLRKAQADVFGSLVRRRIKQFWRSAEEERKLLLNTIIASWSRAAANQERLFDVELKIQEELASAKLEEGEAGNGPAQLQRGLKERKQETEAAVEAMMDKSREFQGQSLKENLARMDELRREQEATMKEATNEAKCALSEQRELWLRALKGEADIDATTRGTLQAIGEQHAVRVAVSCLEAAAQQYYHDAAAEEKESAEVESLAVVDENEQMKQFKESLMERTALLKSSCDEEFHRSSDALWAAFQQHQEACKRARGNILDAQGQFQENRIAVDTWARETEEMLWHEATAPHVDEGTQERMCFAFSRFRSDWEEDLLTWQSGQINERFEASTIDDNRLKQQRGPDWAASCASSGSKALDSLQDNDAGHNSTGAQMALETPRVKLNDDFWARGKSLLDSISKSQREISLAESEWLGRCRAIQGGRTALNANEAKIKRAQTTRLEHMKEGFRSKAEELRKVYAEEVKALLEEDREAEAQMNRSMQAEAANLEMSFRVKEASQDSPEALEELKRQREEALSDMLKDLQYQRDLQKATIRGRLEKAKAALQEQQRQLRQQFEACKEEARKEFLDLSSSLTEKARHDKRAQLLAAARMNPTPENVYALHNQLKEEYRDDLKALVVRQMQEKAKYRHNAAMQQKAQESQEAQASAENNNTGSATENEAVKAELKTYTSRKTSELHQARVREIQEAAQDAALQDEALRLQEEHLQTVIDTLREFTSVNDSSASSLLEHAKQEKLRLAQERDDLRRFVSARLQEVEKLVRERKQQEEKRKLQESHAAAQKRKMSAKAQETAARKQGQEKDLQRQQRRQAEEARKLRQFIEAMGSEGKTLDDLRQASERRLEKLRRATERERQRQKEVLASKRNSRAARQAKLSREKQAALAQAEQNDMQSAQGLLQSIATKCTATTGESAEQDSGENDFRKLVWEMEVKAFAEEKLQRLSETLVEFLQAAESATNSSGPEDTSIVAGSGELRETVLQVTKLLQAINVAHVASRG